MTNELYTDQLEGLVEELLGCFATANGHTFFEGYDTQGEAELVRVPEEVEEVLEKLEHHINQLDILNPEGQWSAEDEEEAIEELTIVG